MQRADCGGVRIAMFAETFSHAVNGVVNSTFRTAEELACGVRGSVRRA
jgi:hypothetical protein